MESVRARRRWILAFLPILLITSFVTSAGAQSLFGVGLPGIPPLAGTSYRAGPYGLLVSSDAKVGYGRFGLNFNLPLPLLGDNIDLAFKGANVWIGSVGVRVDSYSGFFLALTGQGNASRSISIVTAEEPSSITNWDGEKFQWWAIDGSIGYRVCPWWSFLVGLRRDQLTVGLTNPTTNGFPFNINLPEIFQQVQGDFSSRMWIPYLGLELAGQWYKASLLWGPFAWTDIRFPDVFFRTTLNFPFFVSIGDDLEFKVRKTTQFLEYNFEYNVDVSPNFAFQVWSTGSWMQLRGNGNVDDVGRVFEAIFGVPVIDESHPFSEGGTATYTRSMISGGIGAVLAF